MVGLSRTSKTDNSNSLTLSFLYKPFLLRLWKANHNIMKRTLFVVVLTLVNIVAYCQVGVKNEGHYTVCTYDKAYLKSDNTGMENPV